MQSKVKISAGRTLLAATLLGLVGAAGVSSSVIAQTTNDLTAQATKEALDSWHESIKHLAPPTEGCFEASYPSMIWEKVACHAKVNYRSAPRLKKVTNANGETTEQVVGNQNDYVVKTSSNTAYANGWFPSATGLVSEKTVNVPFGGQESDGITGANSYTLQLNTNIASSATACKNFGYASCQVWEQFVYMSNDDTGSTPTEGTVFIQNWVFPSQNDYSSQGCPQGWNDATQPFGTPQCYVNSNMATAPAVSGIDLAGMDLTGSASKNGNDVVTFAYGGKAYSESESDNTSDLSSWWNESEFNVVGNAGGSEAQYTAGKTGATVKVRVGVEDGSNSAPTCVANAGTTGETNNFTLGACNATAGVTGSSRPAINFDETLAAPAAAAK